jgi:hypothetical protein
MARHLNLRADQLTDFLLIGDLDLHVLASLESKVRQSKPLLRIGALRRLLVEALGDRPKEVEALLRELVFLVRLRTAGWDTKDIVAAVGEHITSRTDLASERVARWHAVEPTLRELLGASSLAILVKTLDLTYAHASVLQSARIISDIRPVFSEDALSVEGAVISFSLQVQYYGPGGTRAISIAMDKKDLDDLLAQCERANVKARAALDVLTVRAGVPAFIAEPEDR